MSGTAAANAQTSSQSRQWKSDCVVQHIGDTRSNSAVRLINQACGYLSSGRSSLHPRESAYWQCILRVVPGSQSNAATSSLARACRHRSQR
jgi:hypothetical protein